MMYELGFCLSVTTLIMSQYFYAGSKDAYRKSQAFMAGISNESRDFLSSRMDLSEPQKRYYTNIVIQLILIVLCVFFVYKMSGL